MSIKKNYYLSPENRSIHKINILSFSQNILNYIKLEKEILKLINYLRTNPIRYLYEYNNYFENEDLDIIINEINNLDIKLLKLDTKKEISQAGKDYLDYLIENTTDISYFNFDKGGKKYFNLRTRLSYYGKRYGKIFESVIINSSCAEEIVNKLLKDDKARDMILSPKMKYIGITCGYLPKLNNICTIIDIVQDFKSYKDNDIINNNRNSNSPIQIINTIDFDENDNNCENKEQKELFITYKVKDSDNNNNNSNINKNNYYNTVNDEKLKKSTIDYDDKTYKFNEKHEKRKILLERKKINDILYCRNEDNQFNSTSERKTKLLGPLATYKSDAHLAFSQSHANLKKSFSSMKGIHSGIYNSNNCSVNTGIHMTVAGNNYRNLQELFENKKNKSNKKDKNNCMNKTLVNLKEKKEKEKSKHKDNEIKIRLIKKEEKKIENEKKKINDEEKSLRNTNFSLKNIDLNKISFNDNKDISKIEKKNNETITYLKNNNGNEINNYNISFDNNTYCFFSKDNQNSENTLNENDNNNNLLLNVYQNKKQNSIFSYNTKINNLK